MDLEDTTERRRNMRRPLASLAAAGAVCLSLLISGAGITSVSTHAAKQYHSPAATVHAYFRILNAGMQSGDFSAMASVYAPNGTLTQSNPLGQTKVSHGVSEIIAYYKTAYTKLAGYHFTQDAMRALSSDTLLSYEHAGSPPLSVAARCAHVFVIKNGKIKTLDWVTFYPGQK